MNTRGTWVLSGGQMIPKHLYHRPEPRRSELPAPMLIRDGMDIMMNHADGKRYDSKRAYEKAVHAAGCRIVGNEERDYSPPEMPSATEDFAASLNHIEMTSPDRIRRKRKK